MSKYINGKGIKSYLFKTLEKKVLKCLTCYHHCILEDGHRGICGIMHNYKGELFNLVNQAPCSLHLDPIEKKPLYHFFPGTYIYSIGTVGCNMRCSFCQNWQTSQSPKGSNLDLEDVAKRLYGKSTTPEKAVSEALKAKCNSIAYTYNEPTVFCDFIYDCAKLAHSKGIKNVLVSNGYQSLEAINFLAPYIDAINVDLKSFNNAFYSKLCGCRTNPILRNIRIWHALGVWVEVTTLLIPGENDSDEEIEQIAKYLHSIDPEIVWHLSAYRDAFRMHGKGRTPLSLLKHAAEIGKRVGLQYIYLGNVSSEEHSTTYCKNCKKKLVTRGHWGRGGKLKNLTKDGNCKKCNQRIPGWWTDNCVNLYGGKQKTTTIPEEFCKVKIRDPMIIDDDKPNIKILFATQTGVSEEYAKELKIEGEKLGKYNIEVFDLEEYDEKNLKNESFVIIVTSTFFYGRIPRNGERFLSYIRQQKDSNLLKGLKYVVFGIGSTGTKKEHLITFQVIAREIDKKMAFLGGNRILKIAEADKKKNFKNFLNQWKEEFWSNM